MYLLSFMYLEMYLTYSLQTTSYFWTLAIVSNFIFFILYIATFIFISYLLCIITLLFIYSISYIFNILLLNFFLT